MLGVNSWVFNDQALQIVVTEYQVGIHPEAGIQKFSQSFLNQTNYIIRQSKTALLRLSPSVSK
jgi:non-canonical (house-cleaning) NTP pyrophosphatase